MLSRAVRAHGAANIVFASIYAYLGFVQLPSRSRAFTVALAAVVALLAIAGGALVAGLRAARPLAIAAMGLLLAFAATAIALLVAGAAYVRGVYGALGHGVAWVSLVVAALLVELCGILPVVQLRFLYRPDVKRHFAGG
jgi:hypothetical protein